MADSGNWRSLQAVINRQFPAARITSTYRAGSQGSNGADYHSSGDAVDIAPPNMVIFEWLLANYGDSEEIIYTPAGTRQIKNGQPHKYSAGVAVGHYSHIHWARKNGAGAVKPGAVVPNATGANVVTDAIGAATGVSTFLTFLTAPGLWARVGVAIAGLLLVLLGFARLTGQAVAPIVKGAIGASRSASK
jgi:hypothetical protein